MNTLFDTDVTKKGAEFSNCRNYRYALWRVWNEKLPLIMFIGLNPSKANEVDEDPTIKRVFSFARNWGYGGFYMMNLFAYVTTKPDNLKCVDPLGENDLWLERVAVKCQDIIYAWGAFKVARERATIVKRKFPNGKALVINKDGTPRHPLYVPGNIIPVHF